MFLDYIKKKFRVVVIDTEFQFDVAKAYVKTPLCLCMKDLSTGHVYKYWDHESKEMSQHHFDFETTLFVCHYATAEVSYFLSSKAALLEVFYLVKQQLEMFSIW